MSDLTSAQAAAYFPYVNEALAVVILAAGHGSRMRSSRAKVLHRLAGRPLIEHSVRLFEHLSTEPPILVVGPDSDRICALLGERARYVYQGEPLGTAHALQQARAAIGDEPSVVLVLYGDMPLIRPRSVRGLLACHAQEGSVLSLVTARSDLPVGRNRILYSALDDTLALREERGHQTDQPQLYEWAAGLYCFKAAWLWQNLDHVPANTQGEHDLSQLVAMAMEQGRHVAVYQVEDADELLDIDDRSRLAQAEAIMRSRISQRWMLAGVTIVDPSTTYIEGTVQIGPDTVLYPGTYLGGQTRIGRDCQIGPNSFVLDSEIGDRCVVRHAVLEGARLEHDVDVGPYAHLRQGAHLASGVHMGNFGEVKNSYLGPGTKMGHFSYLGDATVGRNVNIGAGTITCNFDGQGKHPTIIDDDAFIGSDTMLVAPVRVGEGARTGAGSVVTRDVPPGKLVLGVPARVRESQRQEPQEE